MQGWKEKLPHIRFNYRSCQIQGTSYVPSISVTSLLYFFLKSTVARQQKYGDVNGFIVTAQSIKSRNNKCNEIGKFSATGHSIWFLICNGQDLSGAKIISFCHASYFSKDYKKLFMKHHSCFIKTFKISFAYMLVS